MRIGHTELFVGDPQASKKFYVDVLGFKVISDQADGRIVWVALGEREILLRPGTPPASPPEYPKTRSGIVLYTDDLPGTLDRLQSRGLVINGRDADGCAAFTDPDGNWFQLVDPAGH
jgi:catechol 2,3-dioxygenase-like lactoylglutathione lyase family enzyme